MATGQETYGDTVTVRSAIQTLLVNDLTELFATTGALVAGSGVKVSSNDSTIGYLNGKLVAGVGVTLTEGVDGGDETLTLATAQPLVKVSSNDSTYGYLNGKLVAGSSITLTEGVDGGNETLTVATTQALTTASTPTFVSVGLSDLGVTKLPYHSAASKLADSPIATDGTNVSIGTTTPGALFHTVVSGGNNDTHLDEYQENEFGPTLRLRKARGDSATPLVSAINDDVGKVLFYGYDGDEFLRVGSVAGEVDAAPGNNDMSGRLAFYTNAGGAGDVATKQFQISSSGELFAYNLDDAAGTWPLEYNTGTKEITYDSSTERLKENISEKRIPNSDLFRLFSISLMEFDKAGQHDVGFIAEDLDKAGLTELVIYNSDGGVEGINYKDLYIWNIELTKRLLWQSLTPAQKNQIISLMEAQWIRRWRRDNAGEVEITEAQAYELSGATQECTIKEEVPKENWLDGVEEITEEVPDANASPVIEYKFDPETGEEEEVSVQPTKTVVKGKRLKANYRWKKRVRKMYRMVTIEKPVMRLKANSIVRDGKFYRKVLPTLAEGQAAAINPTTGFTATAPDWLGL
uniref:Putative tail protein n=1 Tax=viral metagenome TaxID=1070528 RepID=A0A6H1ZUF4_9ZZZZ